jgi:protein TonB
MRNHLIFAATVTAMLSAAIAGPKPPWTVPESDFGGAEPLNISEWYTFEDYPLDAIKNDQQGFVTVSFTIGIDGRMTDCRVIRSSGFRILDRIPCNILTRRARFKPAVDAQGQVRSTQGTTSMLFWMPYE